MSEFHFDFDPADHFTIDAIGPAGQRTFYLQAGRGIEFVSMICEKEQMRALAEGLLSLLEQIEETFSPAGTAEAASNFDLIEPLIPAWRIAQMGVGYDDEYDRIVIVVQQMIGEEAEDEPEVGRFTLSRRHAEDFAYHALEIITAGRPICPFCGEPIDDDGHFCAGSNGHGKSYVQ